MRSLICPETSLRNYHFTLHNSSEERRSRIKKGWEESGRGLVTVLYRSLREGTEESQDKTVRLLVSWLKAEPDSFQTYVWSRGV